MRGDAELLAAAREVTDDDARAFVKNAEDADLERLILASSNGRLHSRHMKKSQVVGRVRSAINSGDPEALVAISSCVGEAYREAMGEGSFQTPTRSEIELATEVVRHVYPEGLVRLYLLSVAASEDAVAAGLVRALLDEGCVVSLPKQRSAETEVHGSEVPISVPEQPQAAESEAALEPSSALDKGSHEEADYTVMDRVLIRQAVASAAGQEGALHASDLASLIHEVVTLNADRKRSWLHVGYLEGLGLAEHGWMGSRPEMNEERRRWRCTGQLLARMRIIRGDSHAVCGGARGVPGDRMSPEDG